VVDQRHINAKASITDITFKVVCYQLVSVRKVSQAHEVLATNINATCSKGSEALQEVSQVSAQTPGLGDEDGASKNR
jgi:hypothetical protein